MLQAETCHRGHDIVEHVIADLKAGPLAHLPSESFAANAAWLTLAAIAHNLTRAAGCLASVFDSAARPATIRNQLTASSQPGELAPHFGFGPGKCGGGIGAEEACLLGVCLGLSDDTVPVMHDVELSVDPAKVLGIPVTVPND
jgi:hypothetical protein